MEWTVCVCVCVFYKRHGTVNLKEEKKIIAVKLVALLLHVSEAVFRCVHRKGFFVGLLRLG